VRWWVRAKLRKTRKAILRDGFCVRCSCLTCSVPIVLSVFCGGLAGPEAPSAGETAGPLEIGELSGAASLIPLFLLPHTILHDASKRVTLNKQRSRGRGSGHCFLVFRPSKPAFWRACCQFLVGCTRVLRPRRYAISPSQENVDGEAAQHSACLIPKGVRLRNRVASHVWPARCTIVVWPTAVCWFPAYHDSPVAWCRLVIASPCHRSRGAVRRSSSLRAKEATRPVTPRVSAIYKVESSRQSLAAAARRMGAPQWCSQLTRGGDCGGGGGNGHRGFLFELFELKPADPDKTGVAATHSKALASLLGEKRRRVSVGVSGVGVRRQR